MSHIRIISFFALLLLSSSLMGQSTDPWVVKKQRKNTGQRPAFSYQTRNGAKPAARVKGASSASPLARQLQLSSPFTLKGPDDEPPREIKGVLPEEMRTNARGKTGILGAAEVYLKEVSSLMQIRRPNEEFVLREQSEDKQGIQHLRMQQQYQGVKVYGSEIILHADQAHVVQGLNGRYMASPYSLNTTPSVRKEAAIQTSLDFFRKSGNLHRLDAQQKQLLKYNGPTAELMILPSWLADEPTLAWRVIVRPNILDHWEMFVDAQTGKLIDQTNMTCTFAPEFNKLEKTEKHAHTHSHDKHKHTHTPATSHGLMAPGQGNGIDLNGVDQPLNIWQLGNVSGLIDASKDMFTGNVNTEIGDLEGVIITYDAERVPNAETVTVVNESGTTFSDPAAVSAHYNASLAYDYFRTMHNRTSIDGAGGNILSVVNIVEADGSEMDNAYWNGAYMAYGNGNLAFKPLAGDTDVGGHEMSHGVISNTAGLLYKDQPGAINEHIADVFGVLVDADNFTLGEDVVLPAYYASGAMRDMEDPHNGGSSLNDNGWQPNHMSEVYTGTADNGGVHINSGIPNRAFFLIATQLDRERAGAIYYQALTNYLTASAEFIDLRRAIINAANDLYGEEEVQVVAEAFDSVGIVDDDTDPDDDQEPDEDDELPSIGGEDLLLTVNTDAGDGNSLYLINLSQDDFEPISVTSVKRKPTVMDDGSTAFFVTEDETIQAISLSPPYEEVVISEESLWANLSISKDGQRLAIISNQQLPEIWVADLTKEADNFMKFELYNPTSQEGVVTYDVQYADAIEWDYSGEYLIYDAFNKVETFGIERDLEYWDVNFIRVWNNTADDFGDGDITKIFPSLPKGTSIGNPSFSKTHRNIVCFDLFDEIEETYLIIAANLETGEIKTIYENNTLGFPNYSNDDRFLVFDALDEDGVPVMGQIPLAENKLEAAGEPSFPYLEAKWTTWFSQGEREINNAENDLLSFEIQQPGGAIVGTIEDQNVLLSVPDTLNITKMVAKFEQSEKATVYVGDFRQISGVTSNDFSEDVIYTVVAENGDEKEYVVSISLENTQPNPDPDDDDDVVGIEDELAESPPVYPNPFDQEIFLSEPLIRDDIHLSLHNVLGQSFSLVKEGRRVKLTQPIRPGVYLLTIQKGNYRKVVRLLKK